MQRPCTLLVGSRWLYQDSAKTTELLRVGERRSVSFTFGTQSGRNVGVQFECALADGAASAASNFTACTSPMSYGTLQDGAYRFFVRAQGETISDSRRFVKVACS